MMYGDEHIVPTQLCHINELSLTMRKEDRDECMASSGQEPREALIYGGLYSIECNTILLPNGKVGGMFGVASWIHGAHAVWMLGSDDLLTFSIKFLRRCRSVVVQLNDKYPVIGNFVDARNTTHIQWLKWCGFSFVKLYEEYGYEGRPFYEFVRIKQCVIQQP